MIFIVRENFGKSLSYMTVVYSVPSETFKKELFARINSEFHPLTIVAKSSFLDVLPGSE